MPSQFLGLVLGILLQQGSELQDARYLEVPKATGLSDLLSDLVNEDDQSRRLSATIRQNLHVIFLPGIPGSRLTRADGKVIWGKDKAQAEMLALTDPSTDPPVAVEVLTNYEVYGLRETDVYANALKNLETLATGGYGGLIQFGYDWRRDVGRLADSLNEELNRRDPKREKQFVIVAHSFGGVVAWAWQQRYARSDKRVRHLIMLGSPLKGSCEMARTLLEGFKGQIPREDPTAKRLFLDWMQSLVRRLLTGELRAAAYTFPSVFQLLPRLPTGRDESRKLDAACMVNYTSSGTEVLVDLLNPAFWNSVDGRALIGDAWSEVGAKNFEEFRERVYKALALAKSFSIDVNERNVEMTYVYSADYPTTQKILLPDKSVNRDEPVFLTALGDGRVLIGTTIDSCGADIVSKVRASRTHGDLPKAREFEEYLIRNVLPKVADSVVAENLAARRGSRDLPVRSAIALATSPLVEDMEKLIGPSAPIRGLRAQSVAMLGRIQSPRSLLDETQVRLAGRDITIHYKPKRIENLAMAKQTLTLKGEESLPQLRTEAQLDFETGERLVPGRYLIDLTQRQDNTWTFSFIDRESPSSRPIQVPATHSRVLRLAADLAVIVRKKGDGDRGEIVVALADWQFSATFLAK